MHIETGNNGYNLPEGLDGIKNEKDFIDIYEDIKSWYGENFSNSDLKLIKDSRNSSCREYGGDFNDTRRAIARNRIDSILFRLNYTHFCDLDKNHIMRTLSNANTQRNFRDIVVRLENEFHGLYPSEVNKVETRLQNEIKKKPRSDSSIFEAIYSDLSGIIASNRNISADQSEGGQDGLQQLGLNGEPGGLLEGGEIGYNNGEGIDLNNTLENIDNDKLDLWEEWENVPGRLPKSEIEYMSNIPISKEFEDMKNMIFSEIAFSELSYYDKEGNKQVLSDEKINYIKKYATAIFNDFAKQFFDVVDGEIPSDFYSDKKIIVIILKYMQDILLGEKTTVKELVDMVKDEFFNNDKNVEYSVSRLNEEINKAMSKIDPEELEKVVVTEKELNDIKINLKSKDSEKTMKRIIYSYKIYKYLSKKKSDLGNLAPDQERLLKKLTIFFTCIKRRVLREISSKNEYNSGNSESLEESGQTSPEYATGKISDIKPIAIVENNKQINHFVYGDDNVTIGIDTDFSLLPNERKQLFDKLKEQKKGDKDFRDCKDYFDEYGNIDREKAIDVDPISLENNRRKIDDMIHNLAIEERKNGVEKGRIREISTRKAIMTSCFRAISSFFDTVNNNSENFASELEIEDVNENIEFNEETGIIKMKGTIGANKNYIGLYYNTKTGELSFDNFLAYSPDAGYKIGRGNGEKEQLKIKLPTMDEMERKANSINFELIDKLSLNINQYNDMVLFAMNESIRFNCFKGFMGADMKVNQEFVAQFTEKNILKQDLIKSIYKKFYSAKDIDDILNNENKYLNINEGNEPKQFKLIKLISDSIDHYNSAEQLLNFRLYVNKLDELLSSKNVVEKDPILKALYGDNLSSDSDNWDISKQIMERENENMALSENDKNNRYTYEDPQSSKQGDLLDAGGNIGDLVFYSIFSEEKGGTRIINLDRLCNGLNIISRTDDGSTLLDMAEHYSGFEKNLQEYADELPDFQTQILQENIDQIT